MPRLWAAGGEIGRGASTLRVLPACGEESLDPYPRGFTRVVGAAFAGSSGQGCLG